MNDNRKNVVLVAVAWTVVLGVVLALIYFNSAHAEESSEGALQFTTSPQTSDVQGSFDDGTSGSPVIVNVIPEDKVDPAEAPPALKANAVGYTPTYDITSADSYASYLYDVFLNQGNTFDDFIIFRSGDYRYFLIYGNIKDDLSFSSCNVVQLDYSNSWQSGKRYTLNYSSNVSGSFRPSNYTFLSNIKYNNAFSPNVIFERSEQFKTRVAVYVLAVMTLFSSFRFFRKSTVRSKTS